MDITKQKFSMESNGGKWPDYGIGIYCISSKYDIKNYVGKTFQRLDVTERT